MTSVIDAVIALATVLPLPYSDRVDVQFDRWRDERVSIVVPTLWVYEVVTGIRKAEALALIARRHAEEALTLIEAAEFETVPPSPELNRAALRWSEILGQSKAYDGQYLALAEQLKAEYWTADARLARALDELSIEWAHCIGSG